MPLEYEQKTNPGTEEKIAHIIDYPKLVDTVQLSVARLLDMDTTMNAPSFSSLLEGRSEEERRHMECEVGARFDEELVNYVVACMVGRRSEQVIILADATEGFGPDGGFPWQPQLEGRVHMLQNRGLVKSELQVVRYTTHDDDIQSLSEEAKSLAL